MVRDRAVVVAGLVVAMGKRRRRRRVRGGAGHHFDYGAVAARAEAGTGRVGGFGCHWVRCPCPWLGWVGVADADGGVAVRFAGGRTIIVRFAACRNAIIAVASAVAVAGRRADRLGVAWAGRTFGAVTGVISAGTGPVTIIAVAVILVGWDRGRRSRHGFDYFGTAVATAANSVQRASMVAVHAAVDGSWSGRWTARERR